MDYLQCYWIGSISRNNSAGTVRPVAGSAVFAAAAASRPLARPTVRLLRYYSACS